MMTIYEVLPKLTLDQRMDLLAQGAVHYLKTGVTSSCDAGVAFPGPVGAQDILIYQKAVGSVLTQLGQVSLTDLVNAVILSFCYQDIL